MDAAAAFSGSEAPPERQGRALGSLQSAVAAGALIGPLLGGFLVKVLGFRLPLLIMGILTIICAIAACFLLEERHHRGKTQATASFGDSSIFKTFKTLLQDRNTRYFILVGICSKVGIYGLVPVFAPYVKDLIDAPTSAAAASWVGGLQAATWSATFFGAAWWGRQNDRRTVGWNYFGASFICGLSIIFQAVVQQIELLFALRIVQGFCFSALEQSVFLIVTRTSKPNDRGVRIGATNSLLIIGQILGSFGGGIIGGSVRFEGVFLVMGLVYISSSFLVLRTIKSVSAASQ